MKRNQSATGLCALLSLIPLLGWTQTGEKKEQGPEKWESSIAAFEARDQKTPPPKNAVLFVGSSSIRMWDLDQSWPALHAINNGFGGSTLADSIHFFDRLIAPYDARAILIYAGDNDIAKDLTPAEVLADFKTLASKIRGKFPDAKVIYIAIKPSTKRWGMWPLMKEANNSIAEYCAEQSGFHFADIAAPMLDNPEGTPDPGVFMNDGLHLNDKGYAMWKKVIDPLLLPKSKAD